MSLVLNAEHFEGDSKTAGDQPKPTKFNYLLIRLTWILFELIKYINFRRIFCSNFRRSIVASQQIFMDLSRHYMRPINLSLTPRQKDRSTVYKNLLPKQIRQFFIRLSQVNIFNGEIENHRDTKTIRS